MLKCARKCLRIKIIEEWKYLQSLCVIVFSGKLSKIRKVERLEMEEEKRQAAAAEAAAAAAAKTSAPSGATENEPAKT